MRGPRITVVALAAVMLAGCAARPDVPESDRRAITTDAAPAAMALYSQAIEANGFLYTAGQIGLDPETRRLVEGGIDAQTRQVLDNLRAVLEAGGYTFDDVVQVQAFLVDMEDYGAFNTIYAEYVGDPAPARMVVGVARASESIRAAN